MANLLVEAAKVGDVEKCHAILQSGNDNIDDKDDNGSTALCEACHKGHIEVTRLLLEQEASTVVSNKRAMTPLALACIKVAFCVALCWDFLSLSLCFV